MQPPLSPIPVAEAQAARRRIAGIALRTPLVRLEVDAPAEIYLKLESLQPIGSFKIRGAANAMLAADPGELAAGVATASAGNMAQGVAWMARYLGVSCRVVVPEGAPRTKLEAISRLGGEAIPLPFARWWQVLVDHGHPDVDGLFVHPVSSPRVIAGNATIGLEIIEQLPNLDAVVVPYGGGGLSCSIASVVAAQRPGVPVYAAEVDSAAPLAISLEAGEPRQIDYQSSFVDGIGAKGVLAEIWPMARQLLAGSLVVPVPAVAAAVRLLVERARVVAEGAGAVSVAAALTGRAGTGKVVCIVSGGNIDPEVLATILKGGVPT